MTGAVLWSEEQHVWLGAMGLGIYAHVDAQPWPPAVSAVPHFENIPEQRQEPVATAGAMARAPAVVPPSPIAARPPVAAPSIVMDTVSPRPAAPRRAGRLLAGMPDPLLLALLRASGLNPNEPASQAIMQAWPLDELRTNPAAKRALWPQLRALRKQRVAR